MSSFFVSIFALFAYDSTRALDVRHGVAAGTQRLSASCYQNVLKCFQHCVFVVPLLLLAAGVGFLLLVFDDGNVLLLKYNHSRITQARKKQVEDKQDQSMKGSSHNELDKDNYQQLTTAIYIQCNSG